jgi:hypothetical protein
MKKIGVQYGQRTVKIKVADDANVHFTQWSTRLVDSLIRGRQYNEKVKIQLQLKRARRDQAIMAMHSSLKLEFDYLASRICGQGFDPSLDPPIVSLDLNMLDGGKSSALVLIGRAVMVGETPGVWLVFKIDFRERIQEEINAYSRHVKFRVSRSRRIELLGHEIGSRLGVVCYTFAGDDPTHPRTLRTRLRELHGVPDENFRNLVSGLFETADLHAVKDGSYTSISEYFDCRLAKRGRIDFHSRWTDFKNLIASLFQEFAINYSIPRDPINTATFGTRQYASWAHGDLHSGNIIFGENSELILIDFRDTGRAPRVLDYAVLGLSLRLESMQLHDLSSLSANPDTWVRQWVEEEDKLFDFRGIRSEGTQGDLGRRFSGIRIVLHDLLRLMLETFCPEGINEYESHRDHLFKEYVACSFAWGCFVLDKMKKELFSITESGQPLVNADTSVEELRERQDSIRKQMLALAIYLCFLGNKMK